EHLATAHWFAERFAGRAWLATELFNSGADRRWLAAATALGKAAGLPLVAAGNVHMHCRERRMLQDTLTAIRLKMPLEKLGLELHPNAERRLRSVAELEKLSPAQLLRETLVVHERCRFSLRELRYEYPREL